MRKNLALTLTVVGVMVLGLLFSVYIVGVGRQGTLTPQEVVSLAQKTTLAASNEKVIKEILVAVGNMGLDQLGTVVASIDLDDWNGQDLRMAVLMAVTLSISEKLVTIHKRGNLNLRKDGAKIAKIFASHPFLLRVVADHAKEIAEATEKEAEQKIGEEKKQLLLQTVNLYVLAGTCSLIQTRLYKARLHQPKNTMPIV